MDQADVGYGHRDLVRQNLYNIYLLIVDGRPLELVVHSKKAHSFLAIVEGDKHEGSAPDGLDLVIGGVKLEFGPHFR